MIIPHLEILITTACNLNCRDCADMIPYQKVRFYDKDKIISDMTKVLDSVRKIKELLFVGGETLLYKDKDLNELVSWCIAQEKIETVQVITNGTLMPSESLMNIIASSPKAMFIVSGYGEHAAPHRQPIIDEIRRRNIRCADLAGMEWKNIGNNIKRNRSVSELKHVFRNCIMANCVTLMPDGNVFFCSRQRDAFLNDDYPSPLPHEFFNLRNMKTSELKQAWKRFFSLKYISTCDYCDGLNSNSETIETARQILEKREYIRMLNILLALHDTNDSEQQSVLLNDMMNIMTSHENELAYMPEYKSLHDAVSKGEISNSNGYMLCVPLIARLYKDYRFQFLSDSGENKETSFKERNLIRVKLCSPSHADKESNSDDKADMYISPVDMEVFREIARLGHWNYYPE
jgi:hypothetical protein